LKLAVEPSEALFLTMDMDTAELKILPLELCMKLIGLKEKPTDPYHQALIRDTISAAVIRYGYFGVRKYRQRYLDEWNYLQTLL
jgi:hypothetical protein